MVDYTGRARRDESWRRWRGGKKLATDLRVFYTTKTALDRIAWHNKQAGVSAGARSSPNGEFRSMLRDMALRVFSGLKDGSWRTSVESARSSSAKGRGAPLPGRDAPRR